MPPGISGFFSVLKRTPEGDMILKQIISMDDFVTLPGVTVLKTLKSEGFCTLLSELKSVNLLGSI